MSAFPDFFKTIHFCFKNFTLLSEDEHLLIWKGRNNHEVAKWGENSDFIPWEDHLKFIKSLSFKNTCIYYGIFLRREDEPILIGVQNLNPINCNESGESGLYLFPEFQGKGLGSLMKKEFIDYIFENGLLQKITERVKLENIRNQHLNKFIGFDEIGKDDSYVYYVISRK